MIAIADRREAIARLKAYTKVVEEWYLAIHSASTWRFAEEAFADVSPEDVGSIYWITEVSLKGAAQGVQHTVNAENWLSKASMFVESDQTDEENMIYTYFACPSLLLQGGIVTVSEDMEIGIHLWDRGELRAQVNEMLGMHDAIVSFLDERLKELQYK